MAWYFMGKYSEITIHYLVCQYDTSKTKKSDVAQWYSFGSEIERRVTS